MGRVAPEGAWQPKVEIVYEEGARLGDERHALGVSRKRHLLINGVDVGYFSSLHVSEPSAGEMLTVTVGLLPSEYVVRAAKTGEFTGTTFTP